MGVAARRVHPTESATDPMHEHFSSLVLFVMKGRKKKLTVRSQQDVERFTLWQIHCRIGGSSFGWSSEGRTDEECES